MESYIALLRGINVSGQKKIKMAELRVQLAEIGLVDLSTYIQSGNLIFKFKEKDTAKIARLIEKKIKKDYGFEVPVIVKTKSSFEQILKDNPFIKENTDVEEKALYVSILDALPSNENIDTIEADKYQPDQFVIDEEHIYIYCPNGYGRTKLTNSFFERKLKLKATTRNWRTMNKLVALVNKLE